MILSIKNKPLFLIYLSVLLSFLITMTGCSQQSLLITTQTIPANIVLISIDTLRADHIGSYGFPGGYSATIDRIASLGKIRNTTHTPIPQTTPGHASLLTGVYPVKHGSRKNAMPIDNNTLTLAQILQDHGYSTAGSTSHFLLNPKSSGLNSGFQFYKSPQEPKIAPVITKGDQTIFPVFPNTFQPWIEVNKHAKEWLSEVEEPWFLFLHYYECHAPYLPEFPWKKIPDLHPYVGEIAGVDHAITDIMNSLVSNQFWGNVEIIITADHGESLGEHNLRGHGLNLHFPSMYIPWISMGIPNDSGIQNGWYRIMDIAPTILANRNIPRPQFFDGIPDTESLNTVYGESTFPSQKDPQKRTRSIRTDNYALIYDPVKNKKELYDLDTDPGEIVNIANISPKVTNKLVDSINSFISSDTEIQKELILSQEVKQALEALGYIDN